MQVGGNTASERFLNDLGRRSFLSLWSYPNPYRNQKAGKQHSIGKELCDFLVVFGDRVIIFSDKQCNYRDSGNVLVDWQRWYKRGILASVKQIEGAERWIRDDPTNLFADSALTRPLSLPSADKMIIHRIVIAHGLYHDDGTGPEYSLAPAAHFSSRQNAPEQKDVPPPFVLTDLYTKNGLIHVFEGSTIGHILSELDTVSDFVDYIVSKEKLVAGGPSIMMSSELDLLAYHMTHMTDQGKHGLDHFTGHNAVLIESGIWDEFVTSEHYRDRFLANKPSYDWDRLIEIFAEDIDYVHEGYPPPNPSDGELILQFMAAENRFKRRGLATALRGVFERSSGPHDRFARVVIPSNRGDPYYVFLGLRRPDFIEPEEYRQIRMYILESYTKVLCAQDSGAVDVVGIAMNLGGPGPYSSEAMYYDGRQYHRSQRAEIMRDAREMGILQNTTMQPFHFDEFPRSTDPPRMKGRNRNSPCRCGSGKKYKNCCLRKDQTSSLIS